MKQNVGKTDRIIRIVLGLLCAAAALAGTPGGVARPVLALIAVISLATAAAGFCGLYALAGVSTCSIEKAEEKDREEAAGQE